MAKREIDFDNPDQFEFWRAAMGEHTPIPEFLWRSTAHVPGRDEILMDAVEATFVAARTNSYSRPRGFVAPIDVIAIGLGMDADRATLAPQRERLVMWYMAGLVLRLAKQDVRYWGVEDFDRERYCSTCREVRPAEEFDACDYICDNCAPRPRLARAA